MTIKSYFFMLFNKTIRMYYSLFVFRFYYKIKGLSFKNLAGRQLTRLWPAGMGPGLGLKRAGRAGPGRAGPGPNINGLGPARAGPGPKV